LRGHSSAVPESAIDGLGIAILETLDDHVEHVDISLSCKRAPAEAGSVSSNKVAAGVEAGGYKNILIYNNYKGLQHSYMLVSSLNAL